MLSRHLPLITTRINFTANKVSVIHPTITHRTSFAKEVECRDLTPSVQSILGNEEPNDQILDDVRIVDEDGESELSEDPEDVEFPATQIPKPAGEPGRPNSGGYNLEDALAPWGREQLGKVTIFTKKMADLKLDPRKSYSKQDCKQVDRLCDTLARNYPIVDKYEDRWPVRAILKMHLKATSENYRRGAGPQRRK